MVCLSMNKENRGKVRHIVIVKDRKEARVRVSQGLGKVEKAPKIRPSFFNIRE